MLSDDDKYQEDRAGDITESDRAGEQEESSSDGMGKPLFKR